MYTPYSFQPHSFNESVSNGANQDGRQRNFQNLKIDVDGVKPQGNGLDNPGMYCQDYADLMDIDTNMGIENIDPNLMDMTMEDIAMAAESFPDWTHRNANSYGDLGNQFDDPTLAGNAGHRPSFPPTSYGTPLENIFGEAPQIDPTFSGQGFYGSGPFVGNRPQVALPTPAATPTTQQGHQDNHLNQPAQVHYGGVLSGYGRPMNYLLQPAWEKQTVQTHQHQVQQAGHQQGTWNINVQEPPRSIPVEVQAAAFGYNANKPQAASAFPALFNGLPEIYGNMPQGYNGAQPFMQAPMMQPMQQAMHNQFPASGYGVPADHNAHQGGMMLARHSAPNYGQQIPPIPLPQGHSKPFGQPFAPPKKQSQIDPTKPKRIRKKPGQGVPMRQYDVLIGNVPLWDFEINSPHEINFTLPEIITLLPKWHHNKSIATRFVNNGISAPIHRAIVLSHRKISNEMQKVITSGLCPLRNTIGCTYRDSMRERGQNSKEKEAHAKWRSHMNKSLKSGAFATEEAYGQKHPEPEFNPIWRWTHENHQTPADWNPNSISVTGWLSDRVAYQKSGRHGPTPIPLPFRELMKDVAKLPEGPDAGDLTRALEYAVNNNKIVNGCCYDYIFPDDLDEILDIVGRTEITPEHYDGAAITRWTGVKPACDDGKMAAPRVDRKRKRNSGGEDEQEVDDAEGETDTNEAAQGRQIAPKPKRARQGQTLRQPEGGLIREDDVPPQENMSESAQVVRFAQRDDQRQVRWLWDPDHGGEILRMLTSEWLQKLNNRLDESPRPLWREVQSGGDAIVEEAINFAKTPAQAGINWRVDCCHAGLVSLTDPDNRYMSLETATDLVTKFEDYCLSWDREEPRTRLFLTATNKYVNMHGAEISAMDAASQNQPKEQASAHREEGVESLDLSSIALFNVHAANGEAPTGYAPANTYRGP
jgi:hypothetical protein